MGTVFRRIHGRIVPIKTKDVPGPDARVKMAVKGVASAAAGTALSYGSGIRYRSTVASASREASMFANHAAMIKTGQLKSFYEKAGPLFEHGFKTTETAKAVEGLKKSAKILRNAPRIHMAARGLGILAAGYGVSKIIEAIRPETDRGLSGTVGGIAGVSLGVFGSTLGMGGKKVFKPAFGSLFRGLFKLK